MPLHHKTKKITVRFSKRLRSEMQAALIKSGYGLHGKSRWMEEAIIVFLQQRQYTEYVQQGVNINQADLTEVEAFYFTLKTMEMMKAAFMQIRLEHPLLEGVQSALVRAAVVYKLMLN